MTFTNRIPPQLSTTSTSSADKFLWCRQMCFKKQPFRWESTICLHPKLQYLPPHNTTSVPAGGLPEIHLRKYTKKKDTASCLKSQVITDLGTKMQNCMEPTVACDLVWAVLSVEADRYSSIWGEKSHLKNHFSSLGNPTICLSLSLNSKKKQVVFEKTTTMPAMYATNQIDCSKGTLPTCHCRF